MLEGVSAYGRISQTVRYRNQFYIVGRPQEKIIITYTTLCM